MATKAGSSDPNAGSRLAALPEEVLSNISIKLQSDDIFALRLTCRDIESKTLHEFAKEYFDEKCFMYTTESLKVLVHIANSPKFRGYLHHVHFITAQIKEHPKHCVHHCVGRCWRPTVRQQEAFTFYLRDQQALRKNKGARALLIEAFGKLPRLKSLSLIDTASHVPLNAEIRGLAKFVRTTGTTPHYAGNLKVGPSDNPEYLKWLTHCWRTLLVAVAESGVKTLTTMETKIGSPFNGSSPTDLEFKPSTLKKLEAAFLGLESFRISLRTPVSVDKPLTKSTLNRATQALAAFAPVLSNVTKFRWAFDLYKENAVFCKTLASTLDLSKVKDIEFDQVAIDRLTLGTIITALTSVEKLCFHLVDLSTGNWPTILKIVQQMPQLEHLHLEYLMQARQRVYLLKQPSDPSEAELAGGFWPGMPDEDEDDWSDGSDHGPPELVPLNEAAEPISEPAALAGVEQNVSDLEGSVSGDQENTADDNGVERCATYEDVNHRAEGHEDCSGPRGYLVCLPTRADIIKQLPVFIDEFNLAEENEDDLQDIMALFGPQPGGANGGIVVPMPPLPAAVPPLPPILQNPLFNFAGPQAAPGAQPANNAPAATAAAPGPIPAAGPADDGLWFDEGDEQWADEVD